MGKIGGRWQYVAALRENVLDEASDGMGRNRCGFTIYRKGEFCL
jgi:hypothetical protein